METEKDFTIPKLFESGCVLQRGEKTRVWGWAPPGASVEVILLEQKTDNETDRLSRAKSRPQGSVPIETRSGQVQAPDASIENYEETVVACCATKADADGTFTSYFENLKAGGPYTLVFLCREVPAEIQETSPADCGQASHPQDEDVRNPQSEAGGAAWQKICCLDGGDSSTFQAERRLPFEKIEASDVWVGDVFVCAGQSNMELPMRRVREKYPEEFLNGGRDRVHVYKVQEAYNFKREASEHADASWNPPFAETSAFSWFLGKELSQKEEVPIGILNLSLGGTPIQAWMSEDALEDWPEYQREKAVLSDDEYCRNLTAQKAAEEAAWQKALCEKEREVWPPQDIKEKEAWPPQDIFAGKNQEKTAAKEKSTDKAASATKITADTEGTHWQPVRLPGSLADAGLENFCGSVMLRKKFSVSDEQAGKKALLRLGTLADADRAYINGVLVGETGYRYPPRRYTVPEGVLQAGENELLIHLVCRDGDGRMTKGKTVELAWEDVCDDSWLLKHRRPESEASIAARPDIVQREELFFSEKIPVPISLEGEWEYLVLAETDPAPEQVFLNRGATGLFHEMVAPALAYTVKGVVWYQGESNDGRPEEYAKLLPAMISNWRRRWMQERLPFVIVQLPNCGIDIAKETADGELPWPMIREAQRQAGKLPDVAVTVNLDIGEDNDLHPLNKKEAARRAALALRKIVYHEDVVCSGPKLCGWEKHTDGLVLHFDRTVVCRTVQNSKRTEDVLANAAVKESAEKTCVPDGLFELYCENPGWMPAKAELHCQEIRLQPVLPADTDSVAWADSSSHSADTDSVACTDSSGHSADTDSAAWADSSSHSADTDSAACADSSSHSADTDSFTEKSVLAVRYAWSNAPGSRLLYGEEGLCVTPFCEWLSCEDKCDR